MVVPEICQSRKNMLRVADIEIAASALSREIVRILRRGKPAAITPPVFELSSIDLEYM